MPEPAAGGGGSYGDIAITPDGRYLSALVHGSGIERFAIEADGSLNPLGTTDAEEHGCLAVSPDACLLLVGRTGSGAGRIAPFAVGTGGGLAEIGEATLPSAAFIHCFAVSPDRRHLYPPDSNNGVTAHHGSRAPCRAPRVPAWRSVGITPRWPDRRPAARSPRFATPRPARR